jgi:hypothetical protein
VQDCGDADFGAEVFGIGGNRQHRLRRGVEQKRVDDGLVLVGDGSDLGRQREDDVEVGDLQQLCLAVFHPGKRLTALTLRAVAIPATNGELTISCLMGKIGNGESKGTLRSITEKLALSCSPLRVGPEHGHQFVRRSECPFTQVWWNDGLDGLELLTWIATRVDFGSGQLAVSEPEGYLSNILRRL